jgi:cyclophilin family peptidyl-prolyl cis-trans isomerase/HEAT repeat protein
MRLDLAPLLFVVSLCACDPSPPQDPPALRARPPAPSGEIAPASSDLRLELQVAADRGAIDVLLRASEAAEAPELRLEATRGLARLRDDRALRSLRRALRDPEASVRIAAAFGLSILPGSDGGAIEEALLGALAAAFTEAPSPERGPELAALLRALGRVGTGAALPAIRAAVDGTSDEARLGATDALVTLGRRGVPVSDDFHVALVHLVAAESELSLREGGARALGALAPPIPAELRSRLRADLVAALPGAPPRLAALVLAALDDYPPPLGAAEAMPLVRSADPGLALEAVRTVARIEGATGDAALATALTTLADRAFAASRGAAASESVASRERAASWRLLADALPVAFPRARELETYRAAQGILARFGALREPTLAQGLAHCAAAELVDRGRRWPAKTPGCGLGAVPADLGPRRTAALLADVRGEDALRASYLGRLSRSGPPAVAAAALEAMASVPMEAAWPFLLEGLAAEDVGVVTAALRLLVAHRAALLAGERGPSLHRPLEAARRTVAAADDPQGWVAYVEAARAARDPRDLPTLRRLAEHPSRAVREAALAALPQPTAPEEASRERAGSHDSVASRERAAPPTHAVRVGELASRPRFRRYRFTTSRGAFVIELAPELAPVTTLRFQQRVERGFYDGLTFHARTPGFVVQGGDPRGDGYGGPGYAVRDEPAPSRFERGTLGLALAGPDTGGSQLFVTLTDQPALEGRYTPFARVLEGMDVVDQLLLGDRIIRVEGVEGAPGEVSGSHSNRSPRRTPEPRASSSGR